MIGAVITNVLNSFWVGILDIFSFVLALGLPKWSSTFLLYVYLLPICVLKSFIEDYQSVPFQSGWNPESCRCRKEKNNLLKFGFSDPFQPDESTMASWIFNYLEKIGRLIQTESRLKILETFYYIFNTFLVLHCFYCSNCFYLNCFY